MFRVKNRGSTDEDRVSGSWFVTGYWKKILKRSGKVSEEGDQDVMEVGVVGGRSIGKQGIFGFYKGKVIFKAGVRRRKYEKRLSESLSSAGSDTVMSEIFRGVEVVADQIEEGDGSFDDDEDSRREFVVV